MAGVQYRVDRARVILGTQADRHLLARTQDVSFVEQSVSPMVKLDLAPLPWLRVVTGARGDIFHYDVRNNLSGSAERLDGNQTRAVPSVKANLVLGPWYETEFFANFGTGFHSNDAARSSSIRACPRCPRRAAMSSGSGARSSRAWRSPRPTGLSISRASWSSRATTGRLNRAGRGTASAC